MNSLLVLAKESSSETVMDPRKVLHVDPNEFAQQIAISAIVNEEHEITDHRVTFKRDPTKKGTAIQQFARVFGNAIEQGVKPLQEQN